MQLFGHSETCLWHAACSLLFRLPTFGQAVILLKGCFHIRLQFIAFVPDHAPSLQQVVFNLIIAFKEHLLLIARRALSFILCALACLFVALEVILV